jgi:hypothetical protein
MSSQFKNSICKGNDLKYTIFIKKCQIFVRLIFAIFAMMNKLFEISTFTEEDAKTIALFPPDPHTHDFEELIIGLEGEMSKLIS